ncbi:MAG: carbohydrate ABC transporter permease [Planctomycetes bacterium]|nr:carbohydrate ABC transporter permease [Planctomycetota bacterium]
MTGRLSLATRILASSALATVCLLFLAPFAWVALCSLKGKGQIYLPPPNWLPDPVVWANYKEIFTRLPFALFFKNSFLICILATLGQLASSSLVAFGFARVRFAGREPLFLLLLATMMIPYQVTMIPVYLLFREIGWVDSFLPLIVPQFFGGAFNIFLLRQFFRTIPYDLDEAAFIDGCGKFGVYWRIILPLSKPALTVVAIFTFLWHWQDLIGPLIYLDSLSKRTVALGLAYFRNPYEIGMHLIMAASVVALVPVVVLFVVGQKHILEGISLTGVQR